VSTYKTLQNASGSCLSVQSSLIPGSSSQTQNFTYSFSHNLSSHQLHSVRSSFCSYRPPSLLLITRKDRISSTHELSTPHTKAKQHNRTTLWLSAFRPSYRIASYRVVSCRKATHRFEFFLSNQKLKTNRQPQLFSHSILLTPYHHCHHPPARADGCHL
jgi:hypothetical protein